PAQVDLDPRLTRGPVGLLERLLVQVDADDAQAAAGELDAVAAVAAGQVENDLTRLQAQLLDQELGLCGALLGRVGLARDREPVLVEERLVPVRVQLCTCCDDVSWHSRRSPFRSCGPACLPGHSFAEAGTAGTCHRRARGGAPP